MNFRKAQTFVRFQIKISFSVKKEHLRHEKSIYLRKRFLNAKNYNSSAMMPVKEKAPARKNKLQARYKLLILNDVP
jgi:hypothetical protein